MKDKIKEIEGFVEKYKQHSKGGDWRENNDFSNGKLVEQALSIIKEQQAQLDRVRDKGKLLELISNNIEISSSGYSCDCMIATKEMAVIATQNYILGETK